MKTEARIRCRIRGDVPIQRIIRSVSFANVVSRRYFYAIQPVNEYFCH